LDQRDAFVQQTGQRAIAVVLLLLGSVAMLVLFGVGIGLRPLNELEDAIQKRSGADLSPILRQVPEETKGIVARLNSLFAKVTEAQEAQQRFVSLAAHQLRNPVAAIHTMAEATQNAKTLQESKNRAETLVKGTRNAVRLTNQLLSFERVKGGAPKFAIIDFSELLQSVAQTIAPKASKAGVDLEIVMDDVQYVCQGDKTLLREALTNLVENALLHGGKNISYIRVSVEKTVKEILLTVENDGNTIDPNNRRKIFERFSQASHDTGAGLGLSIASEIAQLHGGALELDCLSPVRFILRIARPNS
jgi:two-component system sensor histidine kinase TctE